MTYRNLQIKFESDWGIWEAYSTTKFFKKTHCRCGECGVAL